MYQLLMANEMSKEISTIELAVYNRTSSRVFKTWSVTYYVKLCDNTKNQSFLLERTYSTIHTSDSFPSSFSVACIRYTTAP
mmetsp:Transcript_23509/g.46785  ORF Transcript_23509/g.46785 Transcript_23509/m.46785 type:complete len:81 (-) Transcript_23509:897-1139(-)